MMYFGGKQSISKYICNFLNEKLNFNQTFVDLFCGSCNIIVGIDSNRLRIANDKHKYLISMWRELQNGWIPPKTLSKEEYKFIKDNKDIKPYLAGFVGFGCSFAGKWFGGFAKSGNRNYCLNAYNSTMKKFKNLQDVEFYNYDYKEVDIPEGALVYCDIPYKDTTQYCVNEVGVFDHNVFYDWVRENSTKYDIYISEYKHNIPDDFEIVLEIESKKSIRNSNGEQVKTIEVLIKYNRKM